jgi:hypothetical protein
VVEAALSGVGNLKIDRPAYREAVWQAYLSRGDCSTYAAIERAASGASLGELLAAYREEIAISTLGQVNGDAVWQFITSAPSPSSAA